MGTGDIVLFNCRSLNSLAVSFMTSSRWNHCGIVICSKNGDICIFEALANRGAQVFFLFVF